MFHRPLPRGLKKAIERLEREPERAWRLPDLAELSEVAPRTLQKHFKRFLGRTPLAFLQQLRFERARQDLLRGDPRTSVTAIATRCGFAHLGRFATEYRRRYGESPSATFRCAQRAILRSGPPSSMLPAILDRPAVALLPFECAGKDKARTEAFEEEIAGALWRLGWIRVATPGHARYELRGKIRNDGYRVRATARLVDTVSGRYVWAAAWDDDDHDPMAFGERLANSVARAVQPALRGAEVARALRIDRGDMTAWELTMRALPCIVSTEAAAEGMALELLQEAVERAPQDPFPLAMAAWCHGLRAGHHFAAYPEAEKTAARKLAARAARLNAGDAQTESMLAAGYTLAHDLEAAAVHANRALALDGGCAWAWGRRAWVLAYTGRAQAAIEEFRIARSLAPSDPLNFLWSVGIAAAEFQLANYGEAMRWYKHAFAENPASVWTKRFLAPACVLAGRMDEARHTYSEFGSAFCGVTVSEIRAGLPWNASFMNRVSDGLEQLGMRP